jgi:hypothetical protein
LPSITLEVVQIGLVVTITVVLAELSVLLEMLKDLSHTGIRAECGFSHFIFL